jgi:hypothetical protein
MGRVDKHRSLRSVPGRREAGTCSGLAAHPAIGFRSVGRPDGGSLHLSLFLHFAETRGRTVSLRTCSAFRMS